MGFETDSIEQLADAVRRLAEGFDHLPVWQPNYERERAGEILTEVAEKLWDNFPYQHPLYAGQMLKPPHPLARAAYQLATWVNPNNHALDGGRASSAMEKDAVAQIAAMFAWREHLGHLTGGGTMANLEALWVAGRLRPGQTVLASEQAHYTHQRICAVLGIPFETLPVDSRARLDPQALERRLAAGGVGAVVVTLGTTAVGAVDPLEAVLALRRRYDFRVHVDAAYGGYFTLTEGLDEAARVAFDALADPAVDSLVVDPHKHGLQPYGCGCVLFRDPAVGRFYRHDSPYTYFSSEELHLGEISLECSRAGAAAVALWATQRLLPLTRGGAFAADLERSLGAAAELHRRLVADPRFIVPLVPQLDIVVWAPLPADGRPLSAAAVSALSRRLFTLAERQGLYLAVFGCPDRACARRLPGTQRRQRHYAVSAQLSDEAGTPGLAG